MAIGVVRGLQQLLHRLRVHVKLLGIANDLHDFLTTDPKLRFVNVVDRTSELIRGDRGFKVEVGESSSFLKGTYVGWIVYKEPQLVGVVPFRVGEQYVSRLLGKVQIGHQHISGGFP